MFLTMFLFCLCTSLIVMYLYRYFCSICCLSAIFISMPIEAILLAKLECYVPLLCLFSHGRIDPKNQPCWIAILSILQSIFGTLVSFFQYICCGDVHPHFPDLLNIQEKTVFPQYQVKNIIPPQLLGHRTWVNQTQDPSMSSKSPNFI